MPYTDSAGVKLNKNADLIIEADDSGAVTSCRDAVTGTEYVGGGGSGNIVEYETNLDVNTSDTTSTRILEINIENVNPFDMFLVMVDDTNGVRQGYYYGVRQFLFVNRLSTSTGNGIIQLYGTNAGLSTSSSGAGIWAYSTSVNGFGVLSIGINRKYSSSLGTINGNFNIKVIRIVTA